jgi:hypothetical protein
MRCSKVVWIALAILALCLVCTLVLVAGIVVLSTQGVSLFGGRGNRIVLEVPGHANESDYYLVRMGQEVDRGTLLAEDVLPAPGFLISQQGSQSRMIGTHPFGGFVSGTNFLLYKTSLDDETTVYRLALNRADPSILLETDALGLEVRTADGAQTVFAVEDISGGQVRCYVSRGGAEADRVARGDTCELSQDGSTILFSESSPDGLRLTAVGVDGTGEVVLLEQAEDVSSFLLSADGSRIAYVQSVGGQQRVAVIRRLDGTVIAESQDLFSILDYAFAPQGDGLYLIGENDEGTLSLFTLVSESVPVASAFSLEAAFSSSGDYLVYLSGDEDGSQTVSAHPMAGGADVEVVSGENLAFALVPSPERILVTEQLDDELRVYGAEPTGSNRVELYRGRDVTAFSLQVVPGEATLYLQLTDSLSEHSLFVSPLDREEGVLILDAWTEFQILNRLPTGNSLILAGREDPRDDSTLFTLEVADGADPITLDNDNEAVLNAVVTADGNEILYTASTGSNSDEVEVRRVQSDGREPYEVLYAESRLVDVQWDDLQRFGGEPLRLLTGLTGTSFCPGAQSLALGESFQDELAAGGQNCYRFQVVEPGTYTVSVNAAADIDTRLDLYDRQGTFLTSDDDSGCGLSPRIQQSFDQAGIYFITVSGYNPSVEGAYSIVATEGAPESTTAGAVPLPFDETLPGAITSDSYFCLEAFDASFYGTMYSFEGEAEDWIIIDLATSSIGSSLEPALGLFDSSMNLLADAAPTSGQEAELMYSLPAAGEYFVLVISLDGTYGYGDDYAYEISLTQGTPPEPGGGPIALGETLDGYLYPRAQDEWTFSGTSGDYVTIAMNAQNDSFDTYLELNGPDGRQLTYDDDGGGNLNSLISNFRLPATGTYTILAHGYSDSASGAYTISLSRGVEIPTPIPGTQTPTGGGTIGIGSAVSGYLVEGGEDQWTFSGTAGVSVTIRMSSTELDSYLELYDPGGALLTEDDDGAGYPNAQIAGSVLPTTGTYRIVARSFGHYGSGGYTLSLQ